MHSGLYVVLLRTKIQGLTFVKKLPVLPWERVDNNGTLWLLCERVLLFRYVIASSTHYYRKKIL